MSEASKRVEIFIEEYLAHQGGDGEVIVTQHNTDLTLSDLQVLLVLSSGTSKELVDRVDAISDRWQERSANQVRSMDRLLVKINRAKRILQGPREDSMAIIDSALEELS